MNVSDAMKLKREIKNSSGIDLKMLDIPEDGFVLYIERKALDVSSYKLLADFTAKNNLSLGTGYRQLYGFYPSTFTSRSSITGTHSVRDLENIYLILCSDVR